MLVLEEYDTALTRLTQRTIEPASFKAICGDWLIYRADPQADIPRTILLDLSTGERLDVGRNDGNESCAVTPTHYGWLSIAKTRWIVTVREFAGGQTTYPGAPDGISRILPNGWPILVKDERSSVAGMTCPQWVGNLVCGELPDGGVLVQTLDAMRRLILWPGTMTYTPRIATTLLNGQTRHAVTTWGPTEGVRMAVFDESDLTDVPIVPSPVPPILVLSVPVTSGPAPLTVIARLNQKNADTWRWLVGRVGVYAIDPPNDGDTHAYQFLNPGSYVVAVRASGPGGLVQTDDIAITVTKPERRVLDFYGLNGWTVYDTQLATTLLEKNWRLWRGDLMSQSPADIDAEIRAAWAWGASVFPLVTPSQVKTCPEGADLEVMDCDRMSNGKPPFPEPNLRGVDPVAYAKTVNALVPIAKDRNQRLWAGVSNMDAYAWWRAFAAALDPSVGLTPHRYPPRDARKAENPQVGATDREDEIAQWFAMAIGGKRPFVVSEFGYNTNKNYKYTGDVWKWLNRIFCWLGRIFPWLGGIFRWVTGLFSYRLTDQQVAANVAWEFAYWRRHGATAAILYQLNDGSPESDEHYGIRRYTTDDSLEWKPVADVAKAI
jgi:PKD repeat protein